MTPRRMFPISLNGNRMEPDEFGYTTKLGGTGFNPEGIDSIQFRCPAVGPRGRPCQCSIPLTLGPPEDGPGERRWHWDGNMLSPTISPSINCSGHPYRCGWHGSVTNGCWQPDPSSETP